MFTNALSDSYTIYYTESLKKPKDYDLLNYSKFL